MTDGNALAEGYRRPNSRAEETTDGPPRGEPTGGSDRPTVTVEYVEADGNVLRSGVDCSRELRPFFSGEEFRTEYSVDVSDVPDHVLSVPVLAHVAPVAWTRNAEVRVPTVDAEFLDALGSVERTLRRLYPGLVRGGRVGYRELVDPEGARDGNASASGGGSGLLFTGGVDSTASFVRHREEEPTLISVNGWTVFNDEREKWAAAKSYFDSFGDDHGVDNAYVVSNMLTFFHRGVLQAHAAPHVEAADAGWYSSVGHGLGLLGLCAPLAHALDIDDLYVAATHWEGVDIAWGSRPDIDDNVRWSGTRCHHDGYELTRQERIELLADHVRARKPDLELRSCNQMSHNCSECEKCYRTELGLLLAGLDPNDHGYDFDADRFDAVRGHLERGDWLFGKDERLMWEDLRNHASPDAEYAYDGAGEFFAWLEGVDFEALADRSRLPARERLRYAVYRNLPPQVFDLVSDSPIYSYVRG